MRGLVSVSDERAFICWAFGGAGVGWFLICTIYEHIKRIITEIKTSSLARTSRGLDIL